jgi:hypothetical protein
MGNKSGIPDTGDEKHSDGHQHHLSARAAQTCKSNMRFLRLFTISKGALIRQPRVYCLRYQFRCTVTDSFSNSVAASIEPTQKATANLSSILDSTPYPLSQHLTQIQAILPTSPPIDQERCQPIYPPSTIKAIQTHPPHNFACFPSFLAISLNSLLKIFPLGLFGIASNHTTPPLNCLCCARFFLTCSLICSLEIFD